MFAKEIVKEAGDYILAHMQEELHVERKSSPTDLVTRLDKEVQNFLVDRIRSHYPDDQFCAEEGCLRASVGYGSVWVIDPIDGTNNFVAQGEDFAIMVAYFENGVGQFGIIYDVMKGDFLIASNAGMLETNAWGVAELANASLGVRIYGSAAISFSKILSGQLLTYITYLQPWDYAAASIIGESLGYQIVTLTGEPVDFQTRQPIMMVPTDKLAEIQSYIYERK